MNYILEPESFQIKIDLTYICHSMVLFPCGLELNISSLYYTPWLHANIRALIYSAEYIK